MKCDETLIYLNFSIDNYSFTEDRRGNLSRPGWIGLLMMVLGPVLVRLVYELFMMFIIVVKNTNQINNRLGTSYAEDKPKTADPTAKQSK